MKTTNARPMNSPYRSAEAAPELDPVDEANKLAAMPDAAFAHLLRSEIDSFQAERAIASPVERAP
jgi:hypothetical protein